MLIDAGRLRTFYPKPNHLFLYNTSFKETATNLRWNKLKKTRG